MNFALNVLDLRILDTGNEETRLADDTFIDLFCLHFVFITHFQQQNQRSLAIGIKVFELGRVGTCACPTPVEHTQGPRESLLSSLPHGGFIARLLCCAPYNATPRRFVFLRLTAV